MNFQSNQKLFYERFTLPAILIFIMALEPLSIVFYLPALPEIQSAFMTDTATVQLTLSAYMIVFALAQIITGPLSDRYGRRPVLLGGMLIYTLASALCLLSVNIETLIVARMLQALGCCTGVVVVRALMRDVYRPVDAARIMSHIASVRALAPALGPVVAGYLTIAFGWQASFTALVCCGLLCGFSVLLFFKESHVHPNANALQFGAMLLGYREILRHNGYRGYMLATVFAFSGWFSFISGSSFVFIQVYEFSPQQYGYGFIFIMFGFITGAQTGARLIKRIGTRRIVMIGSLLQAASGLLMLLLVQSDIGSPIAVLGTMAFHTIGMGLILPNSITASVAFFPKRAGAASGLTGMLQCSIAALIGFIVGAAFNDTAMPMAVAIASCSVACFGVCWSRLLPEDMAQVPSTLATTPLNK